MCQRDEFLTKFVPIHPASNPSHGMVFTFIKAKIATSTQVEFHQLSVVIHPLHVLVSCLFGMYFWSYQYTKYTEATKIKYTKPSSSLLPQGR